MAHRRSTVHDLAALRLHPDGTRVPVVATANARQRLAPYNVKDARGNWIAKDAGGKALKKHRRKGRRSRTGPPSDGSEEETFDLTGIKALGGNAESADAPRDDGERAHKEVAVEESDEDIVRVDDVRSRKRRRFTEDLSFLDTPGASTSHAARTTTQTPSAAPSERHPSAATPSELGGATRQLPLPSSDLLKCIHHFASMQYTAAGQLANVSREARMEKKQRKVDRLRSQSKSQTEEQTPSPQPDEEEEEGHEGEDEEADDKLHDGRTRHRIDRLLHGRRDMYKLFDGSALMALGMLMQEHVASLVVPRDPPDAWVTEMEARETAHSPAEPKPRRPRKKGKTSQCDTAAAQRPGRGRPDQKSQVKRSQRRKHDDESEEAEASGMSSEDSDVLVPDDDDDELFAHGTEDDYTGVADDEELNAIDEN